MRIYYFLELHPHLAIIRDILLRIGGRLSFRRYDPTGGTEYGFTIVNLEEDDLPSLYMSREFSEMYISLKKIPLRFDDWDYPDRAQSELILIEGGRQHDGILALSEMLLQDRNSLAKSLFGKLQRALKKQCTEKGLYANPKGHYYARFYYDPKVLLKYRLQDTLDDDSYIYEPESR